MSDVAAKVKKIIVEHLGVDEAKVTMFNKISGKLLLSIKELETDERESHFYSESNSGATIGSIAGDVLESLKDKTS